MIRLMVVMLLALGTLGGATTARAEEDLASRCATMSAADFSNLLEAPTQITSAKMQEAVAGLPAYCKVEGYVAPAVGFELDLPTANWNGKLWATGCGGGCGQIRSFACRNRLARGYACTASDMGHKSNSSDALWAHNNLEARLDFGYRATHVATVAAKAISEAFYAKAPMRSYFSGCSTGGRQALIEAQRFPWDFDGIVAGSPNTEVSLLAFQGAWMAAINRDKQGKQILAPAKLKIINDAVIARCDMQDNLKDGIIGDPRKCNFDPAELICKGADQPSCLTAEQVAVVKKFYEGPKTNTGAPVYARGPQPGSELNWLGGRVRQDGSVVSPDTNTLRYLGFSTDPPPGWALDFDKDYKGLATMGALYSADNPDLRKFKANGGKIISFEGWADPAVPPLSVVDYYETTERTMGGSRETQDFFRLFMLPGVSHCGFGTGAYAVDFDHYLEEWVEHGTAPDMMVAYRVRQSALSKYPAGFVYPLPRDEIEFSRPAYPYPAEARYKGRGDGKEAANWEMMPSQVPRKRG
jgi:feruloyl esterase